MKKWKGITTGAVQCITNKIIKIKMEKSNHENQRNCDNCDRYKFANKIYKDRIQIHRENKLLNRQRKH